MCENMQRICLDLSTVCVDIKAVRNSRDVHSKIQIQSLSNHILSDGKSGEAL